MKFTPSHEWILLDEEIGTVGITDYAQSELGDVVYAQLPHVGQQIQAGQEVAVLESTKAAVDVYSPVTGEVIEVNPKLSQDAQTINRSAEKEGWLFKIRLKDAKEVEQLLTHRPDLS